MAAAAADEARAEACGGGGLPESVSQLTALRELDLGGWDSPRLPLGLTACQQLARLAMKDDIFWTAWF